MPDSENLQLTGLSVETKISIKSQAARDELSASEYMVKCHEEHIAQA